MCLVVGPRRCPGFPTQNHNRRIARWRDTRSHKGTGGSVPNPAPGSYAHRQEIDHGRMDRIRPPGVPVFGRSRSFSRSCPVAHQPLDLSLVPHSFQTAPSSKGIEEVLRNLEADEPAPGGGAALEQAEALQELEHFRELHGPAPFQILVGEELHGTRRGLFHCSLLRALTSSRSWGLPVPCFIRMRSAMETTLTI